MSDARLPEGVSQERRKLCTLCGRQSFALLCTVGCENNDKRADRRSIVRQVRDVTRGPWRIE